VADDGDEANIITPKKINSHKDSAADSHGVTIKVTLADNRCLTRHLAGLAAVPSS
jgi:hypothetical protein